MEKQIKLKIRADIQELRDFYHTLNTEYLDYKWTPEKEKSKILDEAWGVIKNNHKLPEEMPLRGWSLQHYLPDRSQVCPPWNICGRGRDKNEQDLPLIDTPMMFGFAKRVAEKIPFAFRFGVTETVEGGTIGFHTDDYMRVHFPVYSPEGALWHWRENETAPVETLRLPADGTSWLMDVSVPHSYSNTGPGTRVHFLFMIKKEDAPKLLEMDFTI